VQKRLQDNLLEWEEDYKIKFINQLREELAEEIQEGFEAKLHEILEKERCELEEQARELVTQNIQ